jgi:superoxide dismutase, Cu-Zn family
LQRRNPPPLIAPAPAPAPAPGAAGTTTNASGANAAPVPGPTSAHVSFISAAGSSVTGDLTLANEGTGVSILGEIHGLTPGKEHGFHVHAVGECALPDFKSAGEHFNPTNDPHGGPKSKARHLGDIPNAKADENGRASINVTIPSATLGDKDGGRSSSMPCRMTTRRSLPETPVRVLPAV